MKTRTQLFTLPLVILILIGTIFCWIKSAHSSYNQYLEQLSALADVNMVSIEITTARTPGVPMIPEPNIEFQGIHDKLNSAGIGLTSPNMLGSNTTISSPPCLRIKTYTHYFTMGDPYAFHVQLAIARPVTIPSVTDAPFYAEVWHSKADMGFASLKEVNDKINKSILSQLTSLVNAVRQARK